MYQVIELTTKKVIGTYATYMRAYNKANKLDLVYGRINYTVKRI